MTDDARLLTLVRAIVARAADVERMLVATPDLVRARISQGATRQQAKDFYFDAINHYVYAGDSALHVAAAAHAPAIAQRLIELGADVRAQNRRGAAPLHYAVDGVPGSAAWNPTAQAATVRCLIAAGADPDAVDKSGVAALHRAVRTRCAPAVQALLDGGADPARTNKSGSTPMQLATQNTGRGGSGTADARAQQQEIVDLLRRHGQ